MVDSSEARSILKPIFDQYSKLFDERNVDKVIEYYDEDVVVVQLGKKADYGKEAMKHEFEQADKLMGKASSKISEEVYQMAGDFIIVTGIYEVTTEKMGDFKGDFTQFWRKTGDTYKIIYDAYTV